MTTHQKILYKSFHVSSLINLLVCLLIFVFQIGSGDLLLFLVVADSVTNIVCDVTSFEFHALENYANLMGFQCTITRGRLKKLLLLNPFFKLDFFRNSNYHKSFNQFKKQKKLKLEKPTLRRGIKKCHNEDIAVVSRIYVIFDWNLWHFYCLFNFIKLF